MQQLIRLSQNGLLLHADELRRARGDGFGPFGLAAHDKHRLTERRGLLLQSAGVGQDEEAAGHQVVHLLDIDRVDEVDARMAAQDRERTFTHDRAEMHRIDDLDIRVFLDQAQDGVHDVLHRARRSSRAGGT